MKPLFRTLTCIAAILGPVAVVAGAEPSGRELLQPPKTTIASPITDRFALRGIYQHNALDTRLRYDNSVGDPGTLFSAEDTLGMKDLAALGAVDFWFRIADRHRIRTDFTKITRKGDEVLVGELRFGDDIYDANDRVQSSMDLRRFGVGYTYSLLRKEKIEIGLGLDVHLLQLEGSASVPARFLREQLDTAGPFATLAFDLSWRFTRRFSFNAAGHWLDLSVGDVEGGYQQWHADVQFRAWRNLAFGAGYTQTQYRVDSTDPEFAGFFDMKYSGPEAFVRVSF
jgi:hypothetical protein